MEVCWQDANFGLGVIIPALLCPVSVSSTYNGNVFVPAQSFFYLR